eukprot:TRINITY_DN16021_c0_g1_i1.p1 TRINITY_DN16021_c0_g1~~TRINITY_DN16021_c0_g1_i1.p1  ORF type:complete len:108 (-),score=10.10 TRINITY_DN16021_c0_g1_i1:222-545(-)
MGSMMFLLVDRYFHGLRIDTEHILVFKNFDNVYEIIQHAIKAEDIANYQDRKIKAYKWATQKTTTKPDSNPGGSYSKKSSPSLKARVSSHPFIVNNRVIDHLNVQNT